MADDCVPVGQGHYVVQDGDSVVSIARAAGLLPDTVWNDPANAALKEARKDGELLLPGDRVTVTPIRPKVVACATGARHVFRRKSVPVTVTLTVQDEEGAPFAGKKYELSIDGTVLAGTTGSDGKIEATIDPTSRSGELRVWLAEPGLPNPWICSLRLGELNPVEHVTGVQQRLANLGFYRGAIDGDADSARAAVAAFQSEQDLTASGAIDQDTRHKLAELHRI